MNGCMEWNRVEKGTNNCLGTVKFNSPPRDNHADGWVRRELLGKSPAPCSLENGLVGNAQTHPETFQLVERDLTMAGDGTLALGTACTCRRERSQVGAAQMVNPKGFAARERLKRPVAQCLQERGRIVNS